MCQAIAGVVGGLLQRALQEAKKDDSSEDASSNQASGSQESSAQGACGVCGRGCHVVIRARPCRRQACTVYSSLGKVGNEGK